MIGLDEWIQGEPQCDGPPPCPRCEGRGEYPWPVRTWFGERGLDSEDEMRMCLECEGTGHAL